MSNSAISIVETKNQWLSQHIDVEFPTKESLAGRQLYLAKSQDSQFEKLVGLPEPSTIFSEQDIFKVDFHRLTVMFSLLQSKRWEEQNEQELIVEFLSQIIFSEPCDLYVGFQNGEPSAAAIITKDGKELLVSDVVNLSGNNDEFVASLLTHSTLEATNCEAIYIES